MFDLSITKDPEWIKQREALWKPIEENYKQHLRKKDIEPIRHYFMTGTLYPGHTLSEGAQFDWFPIQNTEAWNYLFQNVIQDPLVYEKHFYFQFEDLSNRALTHEQELEMWNYFVGDVFNPTVVSKVPIGKPGGLYSFSVDKANILATFKLCLSGLKGDQISKSAKWIKNINYFITLFPQIADENFERKTKYSDFNTRLGNITKYLFIFFMKPKFEVDLKDDATWLENRLKYLDEIRVRLETVEMQPAMRQLWEDTKLKYEKK